MSRIIPDSDLCAFSFGWLWFGGGTPPLLLCLHTCMYKCTHTCPCVQQPEEDAGWLPCCVLCLIPLEQSLSLNSELTIVCPLLAGKQTPATLPCLQQTHTSDCLHECGDLNSSPCAHEANTYPLRHLSGPLICIFDDKTIFFLINLLGFHSVCFDHASPNSLLSSVNHPN